MDVSNRHRDSAKEVYRPMKPADGSPLAVNRNE
jgi:hypothetical protein